MLTDICIVNCCRVFHLKIIYNKSSVLKSYVLFNFDLTGCQIDHVGKPSWQAQVTGSKRWSLAPPPECYVQCSILTVTVHPGNIRKS